MIEREGDNEDSWLADLAPLEAPENHDKGPNQVSVAVAKSSFENAHRLIPILVALTVAVEPPRSPGLHISDGKVQFHEPIENRLRSIG
jgi:hypothetical protein